MKKIFAFLFFLSAVYAANAQEINNVIIDEKTGKEILIGKLNLEGIYTNSDFNENFKLRFSDYEADSLAIKQLRELAKDYEITLVLGSWCHDSKVQVPHFYKVISLIDYPEDKIDLIGVDRKKEAGDVEIKNLKIKRVPTFIFYIDGDEIGRIIETPEISLEADMLNILK
jgi:thiol-disulfide isomerase/thioredoxin